MKLEFTRKKRRDKQVLMKFRDETLALQSI